MVLYLAGLATPIGIKHALTFENGEFASVFNSGNIARRWSNSFMTMPGRNRND
jgi:hypothetical protein